MCVKKNTHVVRTYANLLEVFLIMIRNLCLLLSREANLHFATPPLSP